MRAADRAEEVWAQLIEPLGRELAERSDDLAAEILGQARLHIPGLATEADGWDALYSALHEGARTLAAALVRGGDPAEVDLPPDTVVLIRGAARRGIPLAPLTHIYRFVRAVLVSDGIARLTELAQGREALGAAAEEYSRWVLAYLDRAQAIVEEAYATERERWLRSSEAASADTIEAILDGRQHDEGLASQRLRHDLRLHHVALVAWPDEGEPEQLDAALTELAQRVHPDAVLAHPIALTRQTVWISRRSPFTEPELEALTCPAGARVAIGTSQPGLDGFRLSYEQALQARRVAVLAGRRSGSVTRYSAVALAALATVDLDQARTFVAARLGALASDSDVALRVASTLRVYLEENASPTRTAKRLGIHENTVANRVRQAERLLGRPVSEQRLELHVALALAPLVR